MDWSDEGIVLSSRKHGESSSIVKLLTRMQGVHAGLVRGGSGKRARGIYQPGNLVQARWRARLAEHLGAFTCELRQSYGAAILDDPLALSGLSAACAMTEAALPERQPHIAIYHGLLVLLDTLEDPSWPALYVRWELGLLQELGFGLDLETCAATGSTEQLIYVSPKSGRAVSRAAGGPYKDVLLPLPAFLIGDGSPADSGKIMDGLKLTGYFLQQHVFSHLDRSLPPARTRFVERVRTLQ